MTLKKLLVGSAFVAALAIPSMALADINGKTTVTVGKSERRVGPANPSASVNANGTLARGRSIVATARLAAGQYQVTTNRNVTTCNYLATLGNAGTGTAGPGEIEADLRAGNNNAVFVATRDSAGAFADRAFHLLVVCK